MRYIYNGKPLYHSVEGLQHLEPTPEQVDLDKHKYGLPKLKKYPMPDAAHVKSAIKFFNYVSPKDEKTLANAILNRMREYGITEVNVGENNRFSKYYHPDLLQHSSGPWENHSYKQKIKMPDGSWFYDYGNTDLSKLGSRLAGGINDTVNNAGKAINDFGDKVKNAVGGGNNMADSPTLKKEQHEQAVRQQQKLADSYDKFKDKPVSELNKDSDTKKTADSTTNDEKSGKKGKGGSGKKGSGSKKSGSGKSGSGKSSAGKASGGKSGKSGSGKSGSSGKSSDADSKKAAKEAKKQQKAQKDYQKELQKMKKENQRKQDEQFEQRRRENEKRWKAEEERMELMRDTSRQSVSKETLSEIIDMLKDSDKEYAKKLLEGGRSKIDDYLDWLKESRKNNSK
jgi:hypothetical protein